jgi:hypothetical protein
MSWTASQQRRLQLERQVLSKYFPAFQWLNQTDSENTRVEGNVCTNMRNVYKLRVYIPSDFPNSRPDMVVTSPYPLKGYAGKDLKDYGTSSVMHILGERDGYMKICHYKDWTPELTLYLVVLKGRIWLEALEGHKRTGQNLDYFLSHM